MNEDYKKRIKAAAEKFIVKNDPCRVKRKNNSPEADLQKLVIKWMNENGFDVQSVDSKGEWSLSAGTYVATTRTLPDIIGNDYLGRAVYVELKAPGRRRFSKKQRHQYDYLMKKIRGNCFAICADSIDFILEAYTKWREVFEKGFGEPAAAQYYLLSILPPEPKQEDDGMEDLLRSD